jgi:hypothetical protein
MTCEIVYLWPISGGWVQIYHWDHQTDRTDAFSAGAHARRSDEKIGITCVELAPVVISCPNGLSDAHARTPKVRGRREISDAPLPSPAGAATI